MEIYILVYHLIICIFGLVLEVLVLGHVTLTHDMTSLRVESLLTINVVVFDFILYIILYI